MKKMMVMLMVIASMATGCAGKEVKKEETTNAIYVKPIEVKEIEVTTWDNVDIQNF